MFSVETIKRARTNSYYVLADTFLYKRIHRFKLEKNFFARVEIFHSPHEFLPHLVHRLVEPSLFAFLVHSLASTSTPVQLSELRISLEVVVTGPFSRNL